MPNTITVTGQDDRAQVLVHVTFDAPASTAIVERSADGGATWTTLRAANPIDLIGPANFQGGEAYLYDTEAPLDVPLTYRATPDDGTAITAAAPVTIASDGFVWIKDPARPWASVRSDWTTDIRGCAADTEPAVTLTALAAETYAADATLSPVLNRPRPADVYAVRKDAVTAAQWLSRTLAAYQAMDVLLAWGGPIFLQLPAVYGWPDRYYQPGDVQASRISVDMRRPQRLWDAPLTVVDAPVGPAQGVEGGTWCDLAGQYPTYADLTATGLTWGQIVEAA